MIASSRYYRHHQEPYAAKTHPHVSAITTHTQGSKDLTQGHKLAFDDTPGKESVSLHSENTLTTQIEHDLNIITQVGKLHKSVLSRQSQNNHLKKWICKTKKMGGQGHPKRSMY